MRYELTDLRLFMAIAQAGNPSKGASQVYITPSSASYRLKNLEHAIGTPLFTRSARGMELTPASEAVLAHVRELFEGIERMHGDVSGFTTGLKGHLRLMVNSARSGLIMPALARFLSLHPDVDVDIEERPSKAIPAAIGAREADVGIFAGRRFCPESTCILMRWTDWCWFRPPTIHLRVSPRSGSAPHSSSTSSA